MSQRDRARPALPRLPLAPGARLRAAGRQGGTTLHAAAVQHLRCSSARPRPREWHLQQRRLATGEASASGEAGRHRGWALGLARWLGQLKGAGGRASLRELAQRRQRALASESQRRPPPLSIALLAHSPRRRTQLSLGAVRPLASAGSSARHQSTRSTRRSTAPSATAHSVFRACALAGLVSVVSATTLLAAPWPQAPSSLPLVATKVICDASCSQEAALRGARARPESSPAPATEGGHVPQRGTGVLAPRTRVMFSHGSASRGPAPQWRRTRRQAAIAAAVLAAGTAAVLVARPLLLPLRSAKASASSR